jgi:hypothetical protein
MLDVEDDLRLYLSKITPIIDEPCKRKQAQPSHWLPSKMFIILQNLLNCHFLCLSMYVIYEYNI